MIGDKIEVKPHHMAPAHEIFKHISNQNHFKDRIVTIVIAGESGCGKSTLALALQIVLKTNGIGSCILHMDDYFLLPPATNHQNRVLSLENVGPHEVNLSLLQQNINDLKAGKILIKKPLVHYHENRIETIDLQVKDVNVLIIEGTYTSLLDNIDYKIFLERNYKDTLEQRRARAREPITPFIESVLEIEHKIISSHKPLADILIGKNYEVQTKSNLKLLSD